MTEHKDYIDIYKEDGSIEQMEVVATFKLEETQKQCIIYKNVNSIDEKYYAASYDENTEYSNLNINFTEEEKEQLNEIVKELIMRGENNA